MAPFRPAAPCVLSAGGVDDRKSIELWLSLHTSDSFPVEQCLCENGAWWSVKCGPCCTLAVWTEEVSLVRRLSPLCLAGASLFTSYQLSLSPASLSLSLSISLSLSLVFVIILGNSICCRAADNPGERGKYNLIICCCQHIFKHSGIRGQKTPGGL